MLLLRRVRDHFGIVAELFHFLWWRRLYWVIPLMIVLLLYMILAVVAQTTTIGPFIYPLF